MMRINLIKSSFINENNVATTVTVLIFAVFWPQSFGGSSKIVPSRHFRNVPKCRHRVCLRRPRPAAPLRSLRAALENVSRFLSSAPSRVRIPPLSHKKAPWAVMGLGRSVLMAGTEGFEPPTAGTKNRSSTVELRPNVWCCPKATRLVYLICEGIANAVE